MVLLMSLLALSGGCATLDPLQLRSFGSPPVRIGITEYDIDPGLNLLPEWSLLNDDLERYLGRTVAFQTMQSRQICVHLCRTGRLQFALLSPVDYSEIVCEHEHEILAVPLGRNGKIHRMGLVVVSPESGITALSDLKGKRFHFLRDEPGLNEAALGVLFDAGVRRDDLQLETWLTDPGTEHSNSGAVARSVVLDTRSAGVIDADEYASWPESGGIVTVPVTLPSKDKVRILAETVPVPNGPFIASPNAPEEMKEQVRTYLLSVIPSRMFNGQLVLGPLGYVGFVKPPDPQAYQPFIEMYRRMHADDPPEVYPAPPTENDQTEKP